MSNSEWLVSEWDARFVEVMQIMAETKSQLRFTAIKELPQSELLWWKQPFNCSARGLLWVASGEQHRAVVGQSVLASAGVDSPPAAEMRSTYLEILRQSMAGLAEKISNRISTEVTCGEGIEAPVDVPGGTIFEVVCEIADSPTTTLYLLVSEGLADAISLPVLARPVGAAGDTGVRSGPYAHLATVASSRTFELLLDVELPLSVSFGRATLRVHEAMNLINGSLIELDRALTDPVELLVNSCVIARGEVVVIEGNYGVRLTEIVSHKERLQQGRRHLLS